MSLHQEEVDTCISGLQEDLVDMQNLLKINYLMSISQDLTFKMLETIYDFIKIILRHILKNIIFALVKTKIVDYLLTFIICK